MSGSGEALGAVETTSPRDAAFDLDAVFRAHYPRVCGVIARLVQDRARAEELAVEVFLKLWREPRAQGEGAPGWLYRTAVRLGLDELRRQTRRRRYEPLLRLIGRVPTPEDALATSEERDRVRRVLAGLTRDQAALLLLRSQDLSYDELAAALGLRPTSVGTLLRRARQAFRKEYVTRHGDR